MDKESETTYLQNIEDCLFDEDKIVTYKWVSKYLGLHVNTSKQLLFTYAKNCPRRNEISLTYLVAGIPKNGEGVQMCVIRDSDLERAKDGFQRITSEHVYSIQKVPSLTDLNILYTCDKDESFENEDNTKFSSIEFDYIKRNHSFFEQLKAKAVTAVKTETPTTSSVKPKPVDKEKKDTRTTVANGVKVDENTADKDGSKKVVVPSMFSKAAAANKKSSAKVNGVQSKSGKQTGMAAFLSKVPPTKPKEESTTQGQNKHEETKDVNNDEASDKELHKSDQNKTNAVSDKMEVEETENEKENSIKKENSKGSVKNTTGPGKEKKKETKKGNKRRKESKSEGSQTKKRRRIIVMDSDSDSSEESDYSEREPTPPPRPATPPTDDDDIITATPEPAAKHQRRRLVNKSYMGSDGFVVTKKEYVFEDCSDTENGEGDKQPITNSDSKGTKSESAENKLSTEADAESQRKGSDSPSKNKNHAGSKKKPVPAKSSKSSKKPSPPKAASPKKNKQQSITNFFTKKT